MDYRPFVEGKQGLSIYLLDDRSISQLIIGKTYISLVSRNVKRKLASSSCMEENACLIFPLN